MSRRPPRGSALAARFRAAIDARSAQQRLEEARQREAQARLERERAALLEDLQLFGQGIGHFRIRSRRERLEFSFDGRVLHFVPQEDGSVLLESEQLNGEHHLLFESTLQKWVWRHRPGVGRAQQRLLFDAGLELLIAFVFGIRPEGPAPILDEED